MKKKWEEKSKMSAAQIVTSQIIAKLEQGVIPWEKPWSGGCNAAVKYLSGEPYSLLNQMMLMNSGEYLSALQAMKLGGHVKKGEKAETVIFYSPYIKKVIKDGEEKEETRFTLQYRRVFHISQCEGIESKLPPMQFNEFYTIEDAEIIAQNYLSESKVLLNHVIGSKACYSAGLDRITMPAKEQFPKNEEYYSTLFHEIGHSTGHESRLNRLKKSKFGDEAYSMEELVAEITAATIMKTLGIETVSSSTNTAAYCQSWIKVLGNNVDMITQAASKAEKAVTMIMESMVIEESLVMSA